MKINCEHIDTCSVDYLTDHHNRDGELLVGLPLYDQMRKHAARELCEEAEVYGKIPDEIPENRIKEAAYSALERVDLRPFDTDGNRITEDEMLDVDYDGHEEVLAWFRFTWEEERSRLRRNG